MLTIEQLIRSYINLPTVPAGTGWFPVLCKVCNDHGKKGPRAAFMFEEHGATAAYHCFNCGHKATYKATYDGLPKDMATVLEAFGVPDDEMNKLRLTAMKKRDELGAWLKDTQIYTPTSINPPEIELPEHFYLLEGATDKWADVARFYLEDRKIEPNQYPFYLSTGKTQSTEPIAVKAAAKWQKRLIIPIYKDNRVVFYQGRDLTGKAKKKYESPSVQRDRVIFGFDRLFTDEDRPLYVVEGFFDAFHIQGVALLGNEISEPQIAWLNRSRREKVYIPDRFGDGAQNAYKALDLGWKVSLPNDSRDYSDCKDINELIVKYGQLYVHKMLAEGTVTGFAAEVRLKKIENE